VHEGCVYLGFVCIAGVEDDWVYSFGFVRQFLGADWHDVAYAKYIRVGKKMEEGKKKLVGVWIAESEIAVMVRASRIDKAGSALLALARKGVAVERGEYVPRSVVAGTEVANA
jgi:hypothetical protein